MRTRIVLLLYHRTKQTVHLHYYWFWVTTVFLDDLMALFQRVCMVLCPEKCPEILKFYCSKKFTVPRHLSLVTFVDMCIVFCSIDYWRATANVKGSDVPSPSGCRKYESQWVFMLERHLVSKTLHQNLLFERSREQPTNPGLRGK